MLGLRGVVYIRLSSWGRSFDPLSFKQRWEGKEKESLMDTWDQTFQARATQAVC